ncbi:MAG TPA: hypothetical protein VHM90_12485 [Phycisphaerae bacterium]|jgi:hypothetical protein|nr:hypothetical protein [Phycisphaerae bacterium]
MSMRCLIVLLSVFLLSGCAEPQPRTVSPNLDDTSLNLLRSLKRDQHDIWRIEYWNGRPMLVTDAGICLLNDEQQLIALEATSGTPLRDAVESGGKSWVLETLPNSARLLEYHNGKWREEKTFPPARDPYDDIRLIKDADRPAVMMADAIWRYRNGAWNRIPLPAGMAKGIPLHNYFQREAELFDLHLGVVNNILFVGIDRGEDGGAMYYLNLDTPSPKWQFFESDAVRGLAVDRHDNVWCGIGLLHGGKHSAGLRSFDGKNWKSAFEFEGYSWQGYDNSTEQIFGSRSSLSSICMDPSRSHLYLLASQAGIFRKEGEKLIPVLRLPERINATEYANGLLVGQDEVFYIADGDAGLLIFSKRSDRYTVQSIPLPYPRKPLPPEIY